MEERKYVLRIASYACNPHNGWRMQAAWTKYYAHPTCNAMLIEKENSKYDKVRPNFDKPAFGQIDPKF